jgi:hypothetical protein
MSQPNNPGPPSVDLGFFTYLLSNSSKVVSVINRGSSICYVLKGSKPIGERIVIIRSLGGVVDFEFAMGTAIKLKCKDELLEWLKVNRNWKDGGYFI